MTGLLITLSILAVGLVLGLVLRARDGSIQRTEPDSARNANHAGDADFAATHELPQTVSSALQPSSQVTLVQLSTSFCAPCKHTHARLGQLAEHSPEVSHTAIDITDEPELARALSVLRTPTTIAYNPAGRELLRVVGLPDADKLLDALQPYLTPTSGR